MTRHHLSLWLLLAAAFACFAALSAGDMPTVCGHTLKSSDIVPTLFSARSTDNAISTGGPTACPAADSTIEEVQFPVPVDTAAQTILFIGDSMLEGLGPVWQLTQATTAILCTTSYGTAPLPKCGDAPTNCRVTSDVCTPPT